MKQRFFITGTDTDVGKTFVSLSLLSTAKELSLSTAALKPVAAGCVQTPDGLRNSDALALQQVITSPLKYDEVNPVALEPAIAPHIAAAQEEYTLRVSSLAAACLPVLEGSADFVLMEGAGGWRVPLNEHETLADLAVYLDLPVVLVVGLRLGCINHARLTAEAIENDGLYLAGWVANQVDNNMPAVEQNVDALTRCLKAPCLGHIPFLHRASSIDTSKYLDIHKLLA